MTELDPEKFPIETMQQVIDENRLCDKNHNDAKVMTTEEILTTEGLFTALPSPSKVKFSKQTEKDVKKISGFLEKF